MNALATILLVLLYPLLFVARVFNTLMRRDPLRLREPPAKSLWIARDVEPDGPSYFSEASLCEGRRQGGTGGITQWLLTLLARLYAPPRPDPGKEYSAVADREQGIPDEVYTLW